MDALLTENSLQKSVIKSNLSCQLSQNHRMSWVERDLKDHLVPVQELGFRVT